MVKRKASWPGRRFPDLELPDHAGNRRRLSELAGEDPLVLQFARGYFCPKERQFVQRMLRLQDEAEVAYTRMVTVTTEPTEIQAAYRAGLGARWTFLSDEDRLSDADRRYVGELDLEEVEDKAHRTYLPYVFVPPAESSVAGRASRPP
jgi:peroxiredoxin